MNYITMTQLRTHSPDIVELLEKGEKIALIHRSRVIGEIVPKNDQPKRFDSKAFDKAAKAVRSSTNMPDSYAERDRLYREALEAKYGKSLS